MSVSLESIIVTCLMVVSGAVIYAYFPRRLSPQEAIQNFSATTRLDFDRQYEVIVVYTETINTRERRSILDETLSPALETIEKRKNGTLQVHTDGIALLTFGSRHVDFNLHELQQIDNNHLQLSKYTVFFKDSNNQWINHNDIQKPPHDTIGGRKRIRSRKNILRWNR